MLAGPYADTKDQFARYCFITVPDLDEAIAWARREPPVTFSYPVPSRK